MCQRRVLSVVLIAIAFASVVVPAVQAQSNAKPQPAAQNDVKAQATADGHAGQAHNEGERVFAQNCSRCHAAPEGFSPRISGTIMRHMRVRASLSERDEKALLQFLNP